MNQKYISSYKYQKTAKQWEMICFDTLFYVVNLSMQLATKYNDNLPQISLQWTEPQLDQIEHFIDETDRCSLPSYIKVIVPMILAVFKELL